MSEFTQHKNTRIEKLVHLFQGILKGKNLSQLVIDNQETIQNCIPSDVIFLVDKLVLMKIPMDDLKKGINKLLNLLYKTISEHPYYPPVKESYMGCLNENNRIMDELLQQIRPLIRKINKNTENDEVKKMLLEKFRKAEKFSNYFHIKENVLFPVIEKYVPEFRCLSVMWSFQDDIKRNFKLVLEQLSGNEFNLARFNRLSGDLFFNIYAVKFREERILYPFTEEIIPENELNSLFAESIEIGFPFYQPDFVAENNDSGNSELNMADLETGKLSVQQIKLLFNHLPVDITFVDENDKVVYFSSPKKRIFPRSKAIIGRDVHNCHPPESVHVVEEIVKSFRNGKKDMASFWINMKGQKLLIQYFAVRDENGIYKGVVEVSQEISEIQKLQGEKRLLDWGD